jgi:hypothetical protein
LQSCAKNIIKYFTCHEKYDTKGDVSLMDNLMAYLQSEKLPDKLKKPIAIVSAKSMIPILIMLLKMAAKVKIHKKTKKIIKHIFQ